MYADGLSIFGHNNGLSQPQLGCLYSLQS